MQAGAASRTGAVSRTGAASLTEREDRQAADPEALLRALERAVEEALSAAAEGVHI